MEVKVLVIGLDGATWNLITPLINKGKLPNFNNLIKNGVYGKLESCIPPTTFPSWKCYSTGKNPGKLGVYWWVDVDIENQRFIINTSSSFKNKEIWDYLGYCGIKCGVIGMPTTYPPKKINGFMVSELCPKNFNFTFPKGLENELKKKLNYDATFPDYHGRHPDEVLDTCMNLIEQRFNAAEFLVEKYHPNFLNLTIFHIDALQHFFWKYMEEDNRHYAHVLEDCWKLVDTKLGDFIKKFTNEESIVFLISDHGFTKITGLINIAPWLIRKGYTKIHKKKFSLLNLFRKLFNLTPNKILLISEKIGKISFLNHLVPDRKTIVASSMQNLIDWGRSKVIPLWGSGLLYLNSSILDSHEREKLQKIIKNLAGELRDPKTNNKIFQEIFFGNELYKNEKSPDIVLLPSEGYEVLARFDIDDTFIYEPFQEGWSAVHTLYGIFIASGSSLRKDCKIKGAKIYDLAPTILHIFNLPIPRDMDGRVLTEIFAPDSEFAEKEPLHVAPSYYERNEKKKLKAKIKKLKLKRKYAAAYDKNASNE